MLNEWRLHLAETLLALTAATLSACGGSDTNWNPYYGEDLTTAATVTNIYPPRQATNVPLNTIIRVQFSAPVNPSSFDSYYSSQGFLINAYGYSGVPYGQPYGYGGLPANPTQLVNPGYQYPPNNQSPFDFRVQDQTGAFINGSLTFSSDNTAVFFNPIDNLHQSGFPADSEITVILRYLTDATGVMIPQYTSTFTTASLGKGQSDFKILSILPDPSHGPIPASSIILVKMTEAFKNADPNPNSQQCGAGLQSILQVTSAVSTQGIGTRVDGQVCLVGGDTLEFIPAGLLPTPSIILHLHQTPDAKGVDNQYLQDTSIPIVVGF